MVAKTIVNEIDTLVEAAMANLDAEYEALVASASVLVA